MKKVTEELKKVMQQERESGIPVGEIAKKYGFAAHTVYKHTNLYERAGDLNIRPDWAYEWDKARKRVLRGRRK